METLDEVLAKKFPGRIVLNSRVPVRETWFMSQVMDPNDFGYSPGCVVCSAEDAEVWRNAPDGKIVAMTKPNRFICPACRRTHATDKLWHQCQYCGEACIPMKEWVRHHAKNSNKEKK